MLEKGRDRREGYQERPAIPGPRPFEDIKKYTLCFGDNVTSVAPNCRNFSLQEADLTCMGMSEDTLVLMRFCLLSRQVQGRKMKKNPISGHTLI